MRAFDVVVRGDDYPCAHVTGVLGRLAAAVVLLLSGCAAPKEVVGDDSCLGPAPPTDCGGCLDPATCPPGGNATGTPVPDLPLGRAWTYEVESFYEPAFTETTIVVAERTEEGYLFAGASPADLGPEAVWERGWHGRKDAPFQAEGFRTLDLPLADGKTWELREGFPLTARAADVTTPLGTEAGFLVEGAIEKDGVERRFRAEYAPSIGAFASYAFEVGDDRYFERLRLTRVSDVATYAWFELGPRGDCEAYGPPTLAQPAPYQVPEGYDEVLVSAGGVGGRGAIATPAGTAWNGEGGATETWTTATFPATAGAWGLSCVGGPERWYFVAAQAVRWTEGTVATES